MFDTATLIGSKTFANEPQVGWQYIYFDTPIAVMANTTYVISYDTVDSFPNVSYGLAAPPPSASPAIRALAHGEEGGNGVYTYGTGFPNNSSHGGNYFADPIFSSTILQFPGSVLAPSSPENCAETQMISAIGSNQDPNPIECSEDDVEATMAGTLHHSSSRCAVAPHGYVCGSAVWESYSKHNVAKTGLIYLDYFDMIRAKFDPSFSCNWSVQVDVFGPIKPPLATRPLIAKGSIPLQISCGTRNAGRINIAMDVPKGTMICGRYYEDVAVQGSQICHILNWND